MQTKLSRFFRLLLLHRNPMRVRPGSLSRIVCGWADANLTTVCQLASNRVFLSIRTVSKPDDSILGMALFGVFKTGRIQLPPWHHKHNPVGRDALANQNL